MFKEMREASALSEKKLPFYIASPYSRVHISSDTAFLKILKTPSIVQE